MDRLQALRIATLLTLATALAGCSPELYSDPRRTSEAGGSTARVNVVRETKPALSPQSWCEESFKPGEGPRLTLPPLAAATASTQPALTADRWTWINLWATWCVPCVAEMDLLARWQARLSEEKLATDFWLLSLDDNNADPERFFAGNRRAPDGPKLRAASIEALTPWLGRYGLRAGTPIPIHLLVAPGGEVRCVRVGAVSEGDWVRVRGLISNP